MEYLTKVNEFQNKYGVKVNDPSLLMKAFTHSSYSNEKAQQGQVCESYERLEFLGDAVLQIVVAEFLYENFPNEDEGFLTKKRSINVDTKALSTVARNMGLEEFMLLGAGAKKDGIGNQDSTLEDVFEAMVGALYLDSGYEQLFTVLDRFYFTYVLDNILVDDKDHKSNLQEFVQAGDKRPIKYKVVLEEGPPHKKVFTVAVYMDGLEMGRGTGRSKKMAEQNAAKAALSKVAIPEG